MVPKRPFDDLDLLNVSSKHPRLLEDRNELVPYLEVVSSCPTFHQHFDQGDGHFTRGTELPACMEYIERNVPVLASMPSWTTSSTSKDDLRSGATICAPLPPDFVRTNVRSEEIRSSAWVHGPHKSVPIGEDYQADIPTWNPQGTSDTLNLLNSSNEPVLPKESELEFALGKTDEEKLMGVCIIPMPDPESFSSNAYKIGTGKSDCACHDSGSVRCVKRHITQAREKLRRTLGQDKFLELGFGDMGEEVAEKWSDDDEQLFHEVVFSNPASLGRNFWNNLSIVFASRSKKEIISYYFNVFMLRRRSEQNRRDPSYIDSDDDEWQGNDDCSEGEDSVVGSPVCEDDPCCMRNPEDVREYGEDVRLSEKAFWKERDDQDVQDDSCTSSDAWVAAHESQTADESSGNSDHWPGSFYGYVLEPCDAKVWDTGFMTCPKNEYDFLPTCNMIEEIFREGDWDLKARDGKDSF